MRKTILEILKDIILKIIDKMLNPDNPKELETPPAGQLKSVARLGLIVGHTKRSGGATFALGGNEYSFNTRVANIAKDYSKRFETFDVEVIFRDVVGISGAYKRAKELNCDVVIELHFNAFNKNVRGTETLTTTHVGDKAFGLEIQKMMCSVFNRGDLSRGLKPIARGDRGGKNVYSYDGYNCLVEPFFGDNIDEARLAEGQINAYARGLVDASQRFCVQYLGL